MTLNLAISSPSQRGMPDFTVRRALVGKFASSYGGFDRQAKLLIIVGLLGGLGGAFISFILVLYLDALGFSPALYGTLIMANEVLMAVILIPSGLLSKRTGNRRLIVIGAGVAVLANAAYLLPPSMIIYLAAAACVGVSGALFSPAYQAMMANKTTESRRKYFFSLQSFASMIGFSTAMLVAGAIPDLVRKIMGEPLLGYRIAIGIGVLFFLLQFIASLFIREDEEEIKAVENERRKKDRKSIFAGLKDSPDAGRIIRFAIPAMLIGIGAGVLIPFFQLQFKIRFNMLPTEIGIVFAFTQITMAAAILILPKIADKIGSVKLIVSAEALATLSLAAMPLVVMFPSFAFELFLGLYVVRTILMNMSGPVSNAFTMSRVSKENRAITNSVTMVSWIGAHALGSFAGGYLMEISLDLPFYICAAFYAAATITYFIFFRKLDDKGSASSDAVKTTG